MTTNRDWMTISEAASKLGVSRQRMHQIIQEQRLKTTAIHSRLTVISSDEVRKIKAERKKAKSA